MATLDDRYGPIEETLLQRLCCDSCGKTLDLTSDPDTRGWLTRLA